jgi:hypothetical protein
VATDEWALAHDASASCPFARTGCGSIGRRGARGQLGLSRPLVSRPVPCDGPPGSPGRTGAWESRLETSGLKLILPLLGRLGHTAQGARTERAGRDVRRQEEGACVEPPSGEVGCARQAGPCLRHRRRLRRGRGLRPHRRCVPYPSPTFTRPASSVAAIARSRIRPANWRALDGFDG